MKQILFFDWLPERTSLRHRRNVTLVKSVCETAPQSMLWASICVLGFGYAPWMACSAGSKPWDKGDARLSRPLDKRGGGDRSLPKIFLWSKNKGGSGPPGSLPWICHSPVGKAIVDLPTRLKGNSKSTTQSVGGPEQGSRRCFAGVSSRGLITSVTLPRADYIGLSFTLENFPDNHPSCPHSWSITLNVTPLKAYPTVSWQMPFPLALTMWYCSEFPAFWTVVSL